MVDKLDFFKQGPQLANRFTIIKKSLVYPEIFIAVDEADAAKKEVVIKVESINGHSSNLEVEKQMYNRITNAGLSSEFIRLHAAIVVNQHRVLVFEKAGANISQLLGTFKWFTLKTTLLLARQMLIKIKMIHDMGIVHRGIKPENFVIGYGVNINKVYLIDFNLAQDYIDKQNNHIALYKPKSYKEIVGNWKFMSVNAHKGLDHSRRDDLESLAYTIIAMFQGSLPWITKFRNKKLGRKKILEEVGLMKEQLDIKTEICGKDLANEPIFGEFLTYCRGLRFEEEPNYQYWIDRFDERFKSAGLVDDGWFDWDQSDVGCLEMATVDLRKQVINQVTQQMEWDQFDKW